MVNVLSIVSIFTLSFSAYNGVVDGHAHSPRHHNNRADSVMHHVPFKRDVSPNLAPLQVKKKRSGLDARRCRAQQTTTSSSSSSTSTSTTTTTTSSIPAPKEVESTTSESSTSTTPTWSMVSHSKPHHEHPTIITPTTTTPPPPATTTSAGGGGGGGGGGGSGTFSGDGTWYGVGLGACGITNYEPQLIAAASYLLWAQFGCSSGNPNDCPICGRKAIAHYGGNSVIVTITDECMGCDNMHSLDFSQAAFNKLTNNNPGLGRMGITWSWA